jgi:hypothetical protein
LSRINEGEQAVCMLHFHAIVQAADQLSASAQSLAASFDQAHSRLERLPRLFIEPDGSFVWRGNDASGGEWQVDGNLIDRGESLAYVELKGCCPAEQFDELLAALGWPAQPLAFQLPRRGVTLDEAEFRRLAASEAGAI